MTEKIKIKISDKNELSEFLESSKNGAEQKWIYHCTDRKSLISIIKNKEFYLKNLMYVNDENEVGLIDVNEFKGTYYVGCFSSEIIDTPEHAEEYADSIGNSIVVAMKKNWFTKKMRFLDNKGGVWVENFGDTFRIFENYNAVKDFQEKELKNKRYCYPYYIDDFGFYKIVYDDNRHQNISNDITLLSYSGKINGKIFIPEVAGIIKKKNGISSRTKKLRDWSKEKEIRLKVCIHQEDHFKNGCDYHDSAMVPYDIPQVVVSLTDDAFDDIYLYFPSEFVDKDLYIQEIQREFGAKSKIYLMDKSGI